jgi:hypothetical protein
MVIPCSGAEGLPISIAKPSVLYSRGIMENYSAVLARKLHSWGVDHLAATLLESGGPLAFLGAQALYCAAPLLGPMTPENDAMALAKILEDPASTQALVELLSETSQP